MAERSITFDNVFNFRDLGGYRGADGRTVRWGRLYRADDLCRLDDADLSRLGELGVRTVVDLRRPWEVERTGRIPEGSYTWVNAHVVHPEWPVADFADEQARVDYLLARYREMAEQGGEAIGAALRLVADPGAAPLVFHCISGKDRTGLVAAFTLHLLGVAWRAQTRPAQLFYVWSSAVQTVPIWCQCPTDLDRNRRDSALSARMWTRRISLAVVACSSRPTNTWRPDEVTSSRHRTPSVRRVARNRSESRGRSGVSASGFRKLATPVRSIARSLETRRASLSVDDRSTHIDPDRIRTGYPEPSRPLGVIACPVTRPTRVRRAPSTAWWSGYVR